MKVVASQIKGFSDEEVLLLKEEYEALPGGLRRSVFKECEQSEISEP